MTNTDIYTDANGQVIYPKGSPTEDTPTPNVNKTGHSVDKASTNVNSQDDERLPTALRQALARFGTAIQDDPYDIVEEGDISDEALDVFLALFTTAQLQLVSELEGELPQKEARPEAGPKRNGTAQAVRRARNKALDEVKTVLQHKKQELERLQ